MWFTPIWLPLLRWGFYTTTPRQGLFGRPPVIYMLPNRHSAISPPCQISCDGRPRQLHHLSHFSSPKFPGHHTVFAFLPPWLLLLIPLPDLLTLQSAPRFISYSSILGTWSCDWPLRWWHSGEHSCLPCDWPLGISRVLLILSTFHRQRTPKCVFPTQPPLTNCRLRYLTAHLISPLECLKRIMCLTSKMEVLMPPTSKPSQKKNKIWLHS